MSLDNIIQLYVISESQCKCLRCNQKLTGVSMQYAVWNYNVLRSAWMPAGTHQLEFCWQPVPCLRGTDGERPVTEFQTGPGDDVIAVRRISNSRPRWDIGNCSQVGWCMANRHFVHCSSTAVFWRPSCRLSGRYVRNIVRAWTNASLVTDSHRASSDVVVCSRSWFDSTPIDRCTAGASSRTVDHITPAIHHADNDNAAANQSCDIHIHEISPHNILDSPWLCY